MTNMQNTYDDSSIDVLKGAERIRKRPAAILGDSGLDGARHTVMEIWGNALDEASSGYGDRIDITYYKDGSVSVRDYGRGVPIGWNEQHQTYNWHLIYNDLYGGGKYNNNQKELREVTDWSNFDEKSFNYLYSVGLNGLGAAATQYSSEYFIVESYRAGVCTRMRFEKGLPIIDGKPVDLFRENYDMTQFVEDKFETDEPDGTFIKWKPDSEVFTDTNIGGDWLFDVCRDTAHVAHIDLHFVDEQRGVDKYIEAGDLTTLLQTKYENQLLTLDDTPTSIYTISTFDHGEITVEDRPFIYVCKADIAIGLAGRKGLRDCCYHNSVQMRGGSQFEGISTAVRDFFMDRGTEYNIKFQYEDYSDIFVVAVSSYSNYASFRNQTKDEVSNMFINTLISKAVYEKLSMEWGKGNPEIKDAVERVKNEAETRIAIREMAKQIKDAKKTVKSVNIPDKFATCQAYIKKNYELAELWITEGDSAAGAVKAARDASFQAVIPVRGKCLNALKASIKKIVKNGVIGDIFSLLGTGMDIGDAGLFDINDVRFGKIIIATDADEDGFQIRTLLFTIFYRLARPLLEQGRVFIAETPRFEISLINGEKIYVRDDEERDKVLEEYAGQVTNINRFKGLGEVNPDVLSKTTVHPETRNLIPLTLDFEDDTTRDLIDVLFGADKYHQRKEVLTAAFGAKVAEMLELSDTLFAEIEQTDIDEETEITVVE